MKISRTKLFRRCLLSSTLMLTPAFANAGDASDSLGFLKGLITGRRATPVKQETDTQKQDSTATPTATSTVQAELQQLFRTGQVETSGLKSMTSDFGVQQVQHQPEAAKSQSQLQQLFSGRSLRQRRAFRLQQKLDRIKPRDAKQQALEDATIKAANAANAANAAIAARGQVAIPKPPPIDYSVNGMGAGSVSALTAGFGRSLKSPPGIPPVGLGTEKKVELKPNTVGGFNSPFIDNEAFDKRNVALDLDSLIDRPAQHSEAPPIITDGEDLANLMELKESFVESDDLIANEVVVTLPAVDEISDSDSDSVPEPKLIADDMQQNDEETTSQKNEVTADAQSVDEEDSAADTDLSQDFLAQDEVEEEMIVQSDVSRTRVTAADDAEEPVATKEDSSDMVPVTSEDSERGKGQGTTATTSPEADLVHQQKNARRQQQLFLITSRAGQTGFKGFCPVELRDTRALRDSSKDHSARFGLKSYQFSSDASRVKFEANPARYAPAAGGSDVVLLANTGEETEGSLDFCLWYRDRLYMFRSRETQAIFFEDPARFADQY